MSLDQITPWLWVGDAEAGRAWQLLDLRGITAVVNATPESDAWPEAMKLRTPYLRLNQDDGQPIPAAKLDRFAAWLSVQRAGGRVILSHCGAGVSRAASLGALALLLDQVAPLHLGLLDLGEGRALRLAEAWAWATEIIRARRPAIAPAPALRDSILAWLAALMAHQVWESPT